MPVPCRILAVGLLAALATAGRARAGTPPLPPAWKDPLLGQGRLAGDPPPASRLLQGRAGAPLAPAAAGDPETLARGFVAARLAPAGELALAGLAPGAGGTTHVTLEQRFAGVPVHLGRIGVAVGPDGAIRAVRVGELAAAGPEPRRPIALTTPDAALAAARRALGRPPGAPLGPRPSAQPALLPAGGPAIRAWKVDVLDGGRADRRVQLVIDAADGALLRVDPLVLPGVARARVTRRDPTAGFTLEACADPVHAPSNDSPAGWSWALQTSGNNTHVQLDREADFFTTEGAVATASGDPPALDFPWTGDPRTDVDAALTNVFWLVNDAHDRLRRLGFDEASGACQADGFGRGGDPRDDHIYSLVQYASQDGTVPYEGVGLGIGEDGGFTYLVAGVFEDASGALRDSAFEADLVYHELAHEASVRMVGGEAACFNGAQPQALSEGWSDFLAASFTDDPVIGAWTSGLPQGVRTGPIGATPYSLVNLCDGGCERFRDGEIWAGLLWDVRQRFIQLHGRQQGVPRAERLAVEALRSLPCRPTFLDARDALLLADGALTGGADRCELWQLFVNRGLGWSSTTLGPDDARPLAGYDLPPECSGQASVSLSQREYAPDDDGSVEVVHASASAGAAVVLTTSGGDALTLPLQRVPGGPLLRASFTIAPGAADPADGVLQAAAGETITVTYAAASDVARISDALDLRIVEHHVYGNWCDVDGDDDDVPDWWVLPRFLDPGEEATIAVTMGNGLGDVLEDAEVSLTSLSPYVRVLPAAPLPLGDVPARVGTAPRRFQADFKATAALGTPPGALADVRMDFRSRGRTGSVTLTLELAMDYVVETGVSPFDGGTETFDAATSSTLSGWSTSAPRGGTTSWRREDCEGHLTPGGWHVGEPGCANYVDGQVASTLVSPPVFPLPAGAVAYRLRDWSFSVDSDLFTDPGNPLCEADFVGLWVTADPASFDSSNPEIIYAGQAQRFWRPLYEDTGGWRTQGPWYYSTQPQLLVPGADFSGIRFLWAFWGDVYDCGFELANSGRFALDDVRFTYDVVRKVPETTSCAADCVLYSPLAMDPPGPKCPGETFTLRAAGWEQLDCDGQVYFSFGGPGVPGSAGWTTVPETTAVGQDGGYYALYTQCETQPDCHDYRAFVNESPAPPAIGTILPGTLRLAREGADVVFSWMGAAAPPSYGVWRATTRAELAAGLASWTLVGRRDGGEGPRGENAWTGDAGTLGSFPCSFFRVGGRDRCSDAPNP